jgi:hypothetical protein
MATPRSRIRNLLIGFVIALMIAPIATMSQQSAIRADPLGSRITVVLDRLTPVIPESGDTLRISGRLVNTSGGVIDRVSVRLGISAGPLQSRSTITEIAELALVPEQDPIDYFLDRTLVDVAGPLRAGDERPFLIQEPIDSLPLGRDGVYSIMVEVLGTTGADSGLVRIGGQRTFLPWVTGEIDPISLVWLWPLADYPAREANGVLLNENTPRSLAPGGRLDKLLTLGANNPSTVSWVADPELLQSATEIATGYQVRATEPGGGEPANSNRVIVGDLSADASNWLTRFNSALAAATPQSSESVADRLALRVMPYADVDASALQRAQMDVDLVRATTMAPAIASTILGKSVSGTVYWAPFGRLNEKTGDVLASAGVRTIILNSSALPSTNAEVPSTGLGVVGTTFGGMNAVLLDNRLTATLALPQSSRSQSLDMRQRFLAETLLMSQLVPADAPSRFVVAGPTDVRWNPHPIALSELLGATVTAPWLESATLSELLAEGATRTARERGGYGQKAKDAELPQEYLSQVKRVSTQLASLTAILDNPTGFSDAYAEAIVRAESSAWRSEPKTGAELVRSIRGGLTEQINLVYALSAGTITLSGEEGLVPVTIANDLDRAVTVGVQLRGSPAARLISEPMFGITIEPGKKVSVELNAQVVGGRALNAGVQLLTPDGQDFGDPAQIQLESTAYAQAAAWVIAAAFIAIIIFVVVGIARRIHKATTGGRDV